MLEAQDRVIVALDCPRDEALAIADELAGQARWVKVGMTLYYACGPQIVSEMHERGFKVFVDLKLHDIPHQVEGAAYAVACAGADIMTVHALGASKMVAAARAGVDKARAETGHDCKVIAVTVLTSMGKDDLEDIGIVNTPEVSVAHLALLAMDSGADGIVCSPVEAGLVRDVIGEDCLIITPGVRPSGAETGDQVRVATPLRAVENGADMLVIGRPITQNDNPVKAFQEIIDELKTTN